MALTTPDLAWGVGIGGLESRNRPEVTDEDFSDPYTQVVENKADRTSRPHVKAVLVPKRGYGPKDAFWQSGPAPGVTEGSDDQDDVQLIVIRQETAPRSGY